MSEFPVILIGRRLAQDIGRSRTSNLNTGPKIALCKNFGPTKASKNRRPISDQRMRKTGISRHFDWSTIFGPKIVIILLLGFIRPNLVSSTNCNAGTIYGRTKVMKMQEIFSGPTMLIINSHASICMKLGQIVNF